MFKTISILETKPETYKNFSSGRTELDEFLKRYAKGNHKKGIGKTFVLLRDAIVVGYYTVCMSTIEFAFIPDKIAKGLPKYPIPAAKIGRLAVTKDFKSQGIGKLLLIDALSRINEASKSVAAFAIAVDAKDQTAKQFYKHFGFLECKDSLLTLYLPMDSVRALFMDDC